jgi:phosphosulfolactate synthase (CoM biosynthesis protein A)
MDERKIGSESREALRKATKLLDLAISRQAEGSRDPEWMIEQARRFIDAGAYMIEPEGITENADPWRTDVPAEVINSLGLENVNFEVADPEVSAWYVKNHVPEVNLFVDHSQIVQLETLWRGMWGTKSLWGRVLTYKR